MSTRSDTSWSVAAITNCIGATACEYCDGRCSGGGEPGVLSVERSLRFQHAKRCGHVLPYAFTSGITCEMMASDLNVATEHPGGARGSVIVGVLPRISTVTQCCRPKQQVGHDRA